MPIWSTCSAASLSRLLKTHRKDLTTYARAFAEKGAKSKATDFIASLDMANRMYATLGPLFERYHLFVCPTTALPAVKADFDQSRDVVKINRKPVDPMLGWVMTSPFNTLSRCPVLTVPSGLAKTGVPTGIQLVGRTYCDEDVFRAGLAFETAAGAWYADPSRRPSL